LLVIFNIASDAVPSISSVWHYDDASPDRFYFGVDAAHPPDSRRSLARDTSVVLPSEHGPIRVSAQSHFKFPRPPHWQPRVPIDVVADAAAAIPLSQQRDIVEPRWPEILNGLVPAGDDAEFAVRNVHRSLDRLSGLYGSAGAYPEYTTGRALIHDVVNRATHSSSLGRLISPSLAQPPLPFSLDCPADSSPFLSGRRFMA
jgi:hypothetical protein